MNLGTFQSIESYYNYLLTDIADPRTNNWFFISDPVSGLTLLCVYLYFSISWGPKFMQNRKPYDLNNILIVYNFLQVVLSCYIFSEGWKFWTKIYSWKCEPVDYSQSDDAMRIASACHVYFLAKLTELLDTVFFVLRKKNNQISVLHLFHHTIMPMCSWGIVKYFPGGHETFIGFINCFVHIIMYSYYLLAAMGPGIQKYLWWKQYLTTLQMFIVALLHTAQLIWEDCGYPRWTVILTLPNVFIIYMLFANFYKNTYKKVSTAKLATDSTSRQKHIKNGCANKIL